jgi:serine protease inhibitor
MMALALVCALPVEGNTLNSHRIEAGNGLVDTDVGTTNNALAFDVVNNVMTIENLSFDVTQVIAVVQIADTGPTWAVQSCTTSTSETCVNTHYGFYATACKHNEQERQRLIVGRGTGGPGLIC